jgi:hypothetical protein
LSAQSARVYFVEIISLTRIRSVQDVMKPITSAQLKSRAVLRYLNLRDWILLTDAKNAGMLLNIGMPVFAPSAVPAFNNLDQA